MQPSEAIPGSVAYETGIHRTDSQSIVTVQANDDVAMRNAIISLSKDPAFNADKLQALVAMQDRMETRQKESEFSRAYAAMEAELPRVRKNGLVEYPGKNGEKKAAFTYARWEDVDAAIRPVMRRHGFSLSFNTQPRTGDGGGVVVTGILTHANGLNRTATMALPLDTSGGKSNLQGYASSTSFGQRYTTKMLLNIVFEGEDDDGVKGGMSFLSDTKIAELDALLQRTGTELTRFLRIMCGDDVHTLAEVDIRDFARLKNALLTKASRGVPA